MAHSDGVRTRVPVFGFPPGDLSGWPEDLAPERVDPGSLPLEEPVLVHATAAADFSRLEALDQPRGDGRLQEAILFLPGGMQPDPDAWTLFDATINQGDWQQLRDLLACPRRMAMADLAEEISLSRLERVFPTGLPRPTDLGAFGRLLQEAPLLRADREHLLACESCRAAFLESLEQRRAWRGLVLCPSVEQLVAHLQGARDPSLVGHLEHCVACQVQVETLRRLLNPAWLEVSLRAATKVRARLRALAQRVVEDETGLAPRPEGAGLERQLEGVALLLDGLLGARMSPAFGARRSGTTEGAVSRPGPGASPGEEGAEEDARGMEVQGTLKALSGGGSLTLGKANRTAALRWSPQEGLLRVEALHREWDIPVSDFRLELLGRGEVLWTARSQEGRAAIPLADLERALERGADSLAIRAEGEAES